MGLQGVKNIDRFCKYVELLIDTFMRHLHRLYTRSAGVILG